MRLSAESETEVVSGKLESREELGPVKFTMSTSAKGELVMSNETYPRSIVDGNAGIEAAIAKTAVKLSFLANNEHLPDMLLSE